MECVGEMDPVPLYKALADPQRLRILSLLEEGPLCVCHLMEILESGQVKVSKQLRYLKELGLVEGERKAQWMIYRLTDPDAPLLRANLACLRESETTSPGLADDASRREHLTSRIRVEGPACAEAITC